MMEEKSMEQMVVYVADIRPLAGEEFFREKMALLPRERQERIRRYRDPLDRQRGLGAGLLLEYGLRNRGYSLLDAVPEKKKVRLEQGAYGKPYIRDTAHFHFNLSHAGDYAAAVFASCEAGIDIEQIRAAGVRVAKRFFTREECAYLEECKKTEADRAFTRMWTRKESYIKAVGEGMHLPLAAFSVLGDVVSGKETYYLHTWEEPEGYLLSVCAKRPVKAEIVWVSAESI